MVGSLNTLHCRTCHQMIWGLAVILNSWYTTVWGHTPHEKWHWQWCPKPLSGHNSIQKCQKVLKSQSWVSEDQVDRLTSLAMCFMLSMSSEFPLLYIVCGLPWAHTLRSDWPLLLLSCPDISAARKAVGGYVFAETLFLNRQMKPWHRHRTWLILEWSCWVAHLWQTY